MIIMIKKVLVNVAAGLAVQAGAILAIGLAAEVKDRIVGVDAKTAVIDVKANVIE